MGQEMVRVVTSIVTAIIGLAILAVLLSKNANTLGLVQNLSTGLAQDIGAATSPVTSSGGIGMGATTYSFATA